LPDSTPVDRKGLFPSAGLAMLIVCCSFMPFMKGCACDRDRVIVPIDVFAEAVQAPDMQPVVDAAVWLWPFLFAGFVTVAHLIAMVSSRDTRFGRLRLGLGLWSVVACSFVIAAVWNSDVNLESVTVLVLTFLLLATSIWLTRVRHFRDWCEKEVPLVENRAQAVHGTTAFVVQLLWTVLALFWFGGYVIDPRSMLVGGRITLLALLLLVETTRWEIRWVRRGANDFRLQYGIRYLMFWTVVIAAYCLWIGYGEVSSRERS
jgi:hypothetical protein